MRQITQGDFTITAEDENIYLRDTHTIVVYFSGATSRNVILTIADDIGKKTQLNASLDAKNTAVTFDITDIIRTYQIGEQVTDIIFKFGRGETSYLTYSIAGLTNPEYLPPHPVSPRLGSIAPVAPPMMILRDLGISYPQLVFEAYGTITNGKSGYECIGAGGLIGSAVQFQRSNTIEHGTLSLLIISTAGNYKLNISPLECGRQYVAVEWESRTGIQKCATWEIRQVSDEVTETVDIQSLSTPRYVYTHMADERKSYETHAVLHLGNLSAYDYWYYSDIITSRRVALHAVPTGYGTHDTTNYVRVVTKSVTIPDGDIDSPYELDVEIIIDTQDAI